MNQPRHILLLRHGLTNDNAAGIVQGQKPTSLNEVGRQQARKLADRLARYDPRPHVVISSDLPRAIETATPIASACNAPLIIDPIWRERGFGVMEGRSVSEKQIWRLASGEETPEGAETIDAFRSRVLQALRSLDSRSEQTIAVVTHGGVCRTILRLIVAGEIELQAGEPHPQVPPIINCSILHLIHFENRWRVQCLNDVSHLPNVQSNAGL